MMRGKDVITVLVVDDEMPALNELQFLLDRDPRVEKVLTARTGTAALKLLQEHPVDLVLLDIHMPGLNGLELAGVLKRFATSPTLVFVTADASHAVEAYDLAAVDYLLKPVRGQRLTEMVTRVVEQHRSRDSSASTGTTDPGVPGEAEEESLLLTQGDSAVRVRLSEISHVTSAGDYARVHTGRGSFLERVSLSELEQRWEPHGFIRVHRSALVRLAAVQSVSRQAGVMSVRVAGTDLPVARRALPRVREALNSQTIGTARR
jgi:two-component system response regulator LytT